MFTVAAGPERRVGEFGRLQLVRDRAPASKRVQRQRWRATKQGHWSEEIALSIGLGLLSNELHHFVEVLGC